MFQTFHNDEIMGGCVKHIKAILFSNVLLLFYYFFFLNIFFYFFIFILIKILF